MTPEDDKQIEQRLQRFKTELEIERTKRETDQMMKWTSRLIYGLAAFTSGALVTAVVDSCQKHLR
jgi:hypothetical protein